MKILKKINIAVILLILFLFCTDKVNAEANGASICLDGYEVYFETTNNRFDFKENIINKSLSSLGIPSPSNGISSDFRQININGTILKYKFRGSYGILNNSRLTSRCYSRLDESSTTSQTDENGNISTTTNTSYTYSIKACGNKYASGFNNLSFKELSGITIDDGTKINVTNEVDSTTGNITVRIEASNGNSLLNVWNRIGVAVNYNGGTSKGNCTVRDNYIQCTGISPYRADLNRTDNTVNNLPLYEVYLYLNGISVNDFTENVSDTDKQSYVDSCGGSNGYIYLGKITTQIASIDDIKVVNPALTDTTLRNLCTQVSNINGNIDLIREYVSECYSEKIKLSEKENLRSSIQEKLNILNEMYGNVSTEEALSNVNDLLCTDNRMGIKVEDSSSIPFESKVVYEDQTGYFGMVCTEDYYVNGGVPSLVKAGTGVDYSNKVQINRTCNIFQLKTIQLKTQCVTYSSYYIRCDHDGDGVYTEGDVAGGPNASFDSCIENCDGGKYTQSCINSCYSSIYSDDDRTKLLSNVTHSNFDFSKRNNIIKVANRTQDEALATYPGTSNGCVDAGNGMQLCMEQGAFYRDFGEAGIFNGGSQEYRVFLRDGNNNTLYETGKMAACNATCSAFDNSYTGPSGCSSNPWSDYNAEIASARSELSSLTELAKKYSQIEDYEISFTDSETGYVYSISGSTTNPEEDQPQLIIDMDEDLSKVVSTENENYNIGNQGTNISGLKRSTVRTVYNVKLPLVHVKKNDADQIIVENPITTSDTNKYYSYNNTQIRDGLTYYTFNRFSNFDSSLFTKGQNVFYTSFTSPLYNVLINSGKSEEELQKVAHIKVTENDITDIYKLINENTNIKVSVKVGGGDFETFEQAGFYCYYGVWNSIFSSNLDDDPGGGSDSGESGGGSASGGTNSAGLRYYYREIDLTDVFPNGRNPRWNWTGTIKNGVVTGAANNDDPSYIVDPSKLVEDIETKGDKIFDELLDKEVDYQFVMTPEIIRKIREYNKSRINGKRITYLDFSLVGTSVQKRNYSKMVSEWYSNLSPSMLSEISECNNAQNGRC